MFWMRISADHLYIVDLDGDCHGIYAIIKEDGFLVHPRQPEDMEKWIDTMHRWLPVHVAQRTHTTSLSAFNGSCPQLKPYPE
jgi:hypothetical protein